jgi:hypothetical protein
METDEITGLTLNAAMNPNFVGYNVTDRSRLQRPIDTMIAGGHEMSSSSVARGAFLVSSCRPAMSTR